MSVPQGGGPPQEGGQPYGEPQPGQPQPGQQQPGQPQPGQQQAGQQQSAPPQYGGSAYGGQPQYGGQQPSGRASGWMRGGPDSPVDEWETRVTGRRTVQYIIDAILSGIVFGLLSWALGNRGTGAEHAGLDVLLVICNVAWYFLYWAYIPYARAGQTIGMSLMRIRVISKDGGPASLMQMFVRSVLLVLFTPLSLLVGIITMAFSRYRQRVGDHMARTVVVKAYVAPSPAQREYAGAGQAGTR